MYVVLFFLSKIGVCSPGLVTRLAGWLWTSTRPNKRTALSDGLPSVLPGRGSGG